MWSRQQAASSVSLVSMICFTISLTLFQKGLNTEHSLHMCKRVPVSNLHLQHVPEVWGNHLLSLTGVAYQCVNSSYAVSCVLVLMEHLCERMHAVFHCLSEISTCRILDHSLLNLSSVVASPWHRPPLSQSSLWRRRVS